MAESRRGRPPREHGRRYHLTVSHEDAAVIDAYARKLGGRPATVAGQLLVDAARRAAEGTEANELAEARRKIAQLEATIGSLRKRVRGDLNGSGDGDTLTGLPRWEWPLADLLADDDWWHVWLPRLYALMGRDLTEPVAVSGTPLGGSRPGPILDDRGYSDVLTMLFPPVRDGLGQVIATWRSLSYPAAAYHQWEQNRSTAQATEGTAPPTTPHVWEPVIRHVAEALCALERTAVPGADPFLRMRVKDELTSGWIRNLKALTGETAPEIPRFRPRTRATEFQRPESQRARL